MESQVKMMEVGAWVDHRTNRQGFESLALSSQKIKTRGVINMRRKIRYWTMVIYIIFAGLGCLMVLAGSGSLGV